MILTNTESFSVRTGQDRTGQDRTDLQSSDGHLDFLFVAKQILGIFL